jgi:hypothetical protein
LNYNSLADQRSRSRVDTTLAKIAFSSGLARSTKIAVLETALEKYFKSTRSIPILLSKGAKLPFDRKFMQQKTGGKSSYQEIVPTRIRILKFSICFLEFRFLHECNASAFVPHFRRFPEQVKDH